MSLAAACSSSANGTIKLVTGEETDTFTRDPAPTQLVIETVDSSGRAATIATVAISPSTTAIDLGSQSTDTFASVRVTGNDANGVRRVFGLSLPFDFGALDGSSIGVFVQRTGELARMPNPLPDARAWPNVVIAAGRFIFTAGGADASSRIYDLAGYAPLDAPPLLPRTPKSTVFFGTTALLVDDEGATSFDLSSSTPSDVPPPMGGTYAEISGGATLSALDGSSYVIGATRTTGDPTPRILRVDPSGTLSFLTLATPRLGAAAAWIEGRGLVVAGGSADGAGVELFAVGASVSTPLPFPSDATSGAGATALDATHVLLAGGTIANGMDAGFRVVDATCASQCAPASWSAALPSPLSRAQAFAIDASSAFIVGDDAMTSATRAFRASGSTVTEVALKVARSGARAVATPTGAVAIVGGAGEIESFVP
jgi:hypothetical protein